MDSQESNIQKTHPDPQKTAQATRVLPAGYEMTRIVDISKDKRLMIALNMGAVLLMIVSGWLFSWAAAQLRSDGSFGSDLSLQIDSVTSLLILLAAIIGLCIIYIPLHEAIHGLCFWIYTHSRPRFAFKIGYAYAAAPDWYIPRNAYLVTALAPLVGISLFGLMLIAFVPDNWVMPVWFILTMNASGSIGDMLAAVWLLRSPVTCMAQDRGDAITLYCPSEDQGM